MEGHFSLLALPRNYFYFFIASVITPSVHYKTLSTTYVVEPKILHYVVHILQSNVLMNILQYVYISEKLYLRKSAC
jgi:hypothetical protein